MADTQSKLNLTPRERDVLKLLSQGYKDSEIAKKLVIEITTVKTHLNRIFPKLGVNTRTEATFKAMSLGIIDCPCNFIKPLNKTNRIGGAK